MTQRKFMVSFGAKGTDPEKNCYYCGIKNFDECRFYTKRDIRDIENLGVGDTWYDPDPDRSLLPKKRKSDLRVKRIR